MFLLLVSLVRQPSMVLFLMFSAEWLSSDPEIFTLLMLLMYLVGPSIIELRWLILVTENLGEFKFIFLYEMGCWCYSLIPPVCSKRDVIFESSKL